MNTVYDKYKWVEINSKNKIYDTISFVDRFGNSLITIGHYRTENPEYWQIKLYGRLNYIFTPKEINQNFLDCKELKFLVQTRLEEYFSKALK